MIEKKWRGQSGRGRKAPSDASSDIDTDTDTDMSVYTDGNAGEADEEIKRAEHQKPNQRSLTRLLQTVPRVWRQFVGHGVGRFNFFFDSSPFLYEIVFRSSSDNHVLSARSVPAPLLSLDFRCRFRFAEASSPF
jgi:hypothetical protein